MAEVWAGDEPCIQRAPSLCPRAGLTKQARIYTEGEVGRLSNGHGLTQIYITSSEGEEPSLEELSSGSTEIVSVRSRRGGRSQSAERILEEERGFTRAELVKQGSAGSYLSWQSESLQEGESSAAAFSVQSSSWRQDSTEQSQRQNSLLDSYSEQQDSLSPSDRADSSFTGHRDTSISGPPPRPESQPCPTLSQGLSPLLTTTSRGAAGRYWGYRRNYTAYPGASWGGQAMDRASRAHLSSRPFRHSSADILDTLPRLRQGTRSQLDQVEPGLLIGNMDAATDILSLEGHRISHIITVDSVPLPRKITSLLPRLACLHIQVTDLPSENLLSHLPSLLSFISQGQSRGCVLVHCYYGRSRSATVVTAFLMAKYRLTVERALKLLREARPSVQPNPGFMAQLRLWECMQFRLSASCPRYKMYRLHMVAERIRKAKLLPKEVLSSVTDPGPGPSPLRSAAVVYKCKACRLPLATCHNTLPHQVGVSPYWYSVQPTSSLCSQSVHVFPLPWMEESVRGSLSGKLHCPGCQAKLGHYSWVLGSECPCGAKVAPAFSLDITAIIFKTGGRHLSGPAIREVRGQSRRPVEV